MKNNNNFIKKQLFAASLNITTNIYILFFMLSAGNLLTIMNYYIEHSARSYHYDTKNFISELIFIKSSQDYIQLNI
jgi:hypothetical protein